MGTCPKERPSYDPLISGLFVFMCIIIPVTLLLAWMLFPDPFSFWWNAFSELENSVTDLGHANPASRLIFSLGWIACGVLMIKIGARYQRDHSLRSWSVKRLLALAGGIGFLVALTPDDASHILHSIGMGVVVATLYFFGTIFLVELRRIMGWPEFLVAMFVLQGVVLTYAGAFFVDSDWKQVAQKSCVLGLMLVMGRAVTLAPDGLEWRAVLESSRK
jgi:hypothetical membrane protein